MNYLQCPAALPDGAPRALQPGGLRTELPKTHRRAEGVGRIGRRLLLGQMGVRGPMVSFVAQPQRGESKQADRDGCRQHRVITAAQAAINRLSQLLQLVVIGRRWVPWLFGLDHKSTDYSNRAVPDLQMQADDPRNATLAVRGPRRTGRVAPSGAGHETNPGCG